jgi:hypothetical protein
MHAHPFIEPLEDRRLLSDGTLAFAFSIGARRGVRVTAQTTDAAGNLYLAGDAGQNTTVDFNPSPRKTYAIPILSDRPRQFLAKYTPTGAFAWARLTPDANARVNALTVDRYTGNLLVGGEYSGKVNFGNDLTLVAPGDGSSYGYYARVSAKSGKFTAVKTALADANCYVTAVESDAAGNVYVAGAKGGEPYLDSHDVPYPTTSAVLLKFNRRDRYVWGQSFRPLGPGGVPDPTVDYLTPFEHIAVTPAGQVYLSGVNWTNRPSPLGLTGTGTYLVSLDGTGGGGKLFGDVLTGVDVINDLAVDAAGDVLVVGRFANTADFTLDSTAPATTLTTGAATDGFLAKYDLVGGLTFVRQIGLDADTTIGDDAVSVAVDDAGYIYVGGSTSGNTYFNTAGTFRFRSGDHSDGFVAKYKARGTFVNAWLLGSPENDQVSFVSTGPGPSGPIYASGALTGILDANPGRKVFELQPVSASDLFVIKLT